MKKFSRSITRIAISMVLLGSLESVFTDLHGQLRTTGTLSSGMVVQRQQDIPLYGEALAGAQVGIEMNGRFALDSADGKGKWEIFLPAMEAGGPYELKIWSDGDTLRLNDIYVGDVWLASGQSNMAMALQETNNAAEEIAASENPRIRQYLVTRTLGNEPRDQPPAGSRWMQADPDHSGVFTAVGYYFAKYLHQHLDIPIGIINSSYGGSRIETWMSKEVLGYDEQDISLGENNFNQATVAYNTMLHPLIHTPIKGVIWYQGESNMGNRETALSYTNQLKALISSWRELWGLEELPFIWVQLPNIGTEANENTPGTWDALPMLRAAMSRTLSLPHTGEITTIDLGEIDIHPMEKEPVGKRLSLVARTLVYSDTIESAGPIYLSHRKMGAGRIEVTFDHVADGLVAKETGDQSLRWFALAGNNGTFHRANAVIVGDKVEVWNPGITEPVSLRYAWEHNPFNTNFYNSENLATRPFKVQIDHPGFELQFFKAIDYYLDKGESTMLTWEWSGAEALSINGIHVDSIGGWRVWPENDSTFTFIAQNRMNSTHKDSVSLTIRVQQPDPTIEIFADRAGWLTPGSEVSLRANASAPLGGTVSLVDFFANNVKIASISEEPFECKWLTDEIGTYNLYGVVTNQAGNTTISDSILKVVDNFEILRFEAEEAEIKGGKRLIDDDSASGAKFVELTRDWTINFPAFELDSSQSCQLSFFTMLNIGSPKIQSLVLNGTYHSDLIFEAPDKTSWLDNYLLLPLDSGSNTISLKSNWGYISMDYLELLFRPSQSPQDTTTSIQSAISDNTLSIYPNPFRETCRVSFSLAEEGNVSMDLFDLAGRKVAALFDGEMAAGSQQLEIRRKGFVSGTYILIISFEDKLLQEKLIVQ